jgi:hypothetical protein
MHPPGTGDFFRDLGGRSSEYRLRGIGTSSLAEPPTPWAGSWRWKQQPKAKTAKLVAERPQWSAGQCYYQAGQAKQVTTSVTYPHGSWRGTRKIRGSAGFSPTVSPGAGGQGSPSVQSLQPLIKMLGSPEPSPMWQDRAQPPKIELPPSFQAARHMGSGLSRCTQPLPYRLEKNRIEGKAGTDVPRG